jgi:predicted transposase/invertase (TIGR01784 family)
MSHALLLIALLIALHITPHKTLHSFFKAITEKLLSFWSFSVIALRFTFCWLPPDRTARAKPRLLKCSQAFRHFASLSLHGVHALVLAVRVEALQGCKQLICKKTTVEKCPQMCYTLSKGRVNSTMGLLPKDIEILPPYDDRLFKAIMTAPKAKPTLLFLAPEIVKRPVVNVLVRNTELPVEDIDEKVERFDVNCQIDDDAQADIEMQGSRMKEEKDGNHNNLRARSIYNLCDLHSSQPSKGKSYDKLIQTYQVMFCNYTVFPGRSGFINTFSMRHDEDNELLHNSVQAMFVELTKLDEVLKKPVEQMTNMEMFSIFLKYAENPNYREIVNKVIESKEGLAVAGEVLMSISKDERERAIFRNRRIALADRESDKVTVERIKAKSIAKNLLDMDMSIEKITTATGLTREEVENLRGGC